LLELGDGTHKQPKKKKMAKPFLPNVGNGAHLHPKATKEKEKERSLGSPSVERVDDGTHLHPQATKHKKNKNEGA
jgi:hypothetical protein